MMYFSHLLQRARAWLPLLPLVLLLVATWWLNQQVAPLPTIISKPRHDVDLVMENFSAYTLDAQGQPVHSIAAEKLWHFPDDDTTHLQMPVLNSLFPDHPPFTTTAMSGMLTRKGDEVFLHDDVHVIRAAGKDTGEQQFVTDYLHVVPERGWADTDRAVVMTSQSGIVRATGMELDNHARMIRLLSQVKAKHEPVPR